MSEQAKCELCGEPMPPGEEMFKFHGYSGNCPKPPLKRRPIGETPLSQEVTKFLEVTGGIPGPDQNPDYRLEIAYRMGYEDSLRNYAIWRDGTQYVGAMNRTLREVVEGFKNEQIPLRY